jgi:hypothetical protein
MGNPQDYGVFHYLDDSLFDNPSFPVKNFTTELFPIYFTEWMTLEGTKDNMHASIKPTNIMEYYVKRVY